MLQSLQATIVNNEHVDVRHDFNVANRHEEDVASGRKVDDINLLAADKVEGEQTTHVGLSSSFINHNVSTLELFNRE